MRSHSPPCESCFIVRSRPLHVVNENVAQVILVLEFGIVFSVHSLPLYLEARFRGFREVFDFLSVHKANRYRKRGQGNGYQRKKHIAARRKREPRNNRGADERESGQQYEICEGAPAVLRYCIGKGEVQCAGGYPEQRSRAFGGRSAENFRNGEKHGERGHSRKSFEQRGMKQSLLYICSVYDKRGAKTARKHKSDI